MVTLEYIARRACEHDTAMALAFRRALGVDGARPGPRRQGHRGNGTYAALPECFRNERHVNL